MFSMLSKEEKMAYYTLLFRFSQLSEIALGSLRGRKTDLSESSLFVPDLYSSLKLH